MVTLTIDNRTVTVPEGTTILEAARTARIEIPTMCYLKEINEIGACRLCIVEVEGQERLIPSCNNVVAEGMVIHTHSPRVREARRVNLRLLLSQHEIRCTKCGYEADEGKHIKWGQIWRGIPTCKLTGETDRAKLDALGLRLIQIGRASCRERV